MKSYIKIALVIIGALIGAGFASGQEIYLFFYLIYFQCFIMKFDSKR